MINAHQSISRISNYPAGSVKREQVTYMAYTGQYELVHSLLRDLPLASRDEFSDKNVLSQAIWGSIEKIKEFSKIHNYDLLKDEKKFLAELIDQFIKYSNNTKKYPRELYQSLLYVSELLIQISSLDKAIDYLNQSFKLGINKFPDLRVDAINKITLVYNKKGKIEDLTNKLVHLVEHPYFITDNNQIPAILFRLSKATLKSGDTSHYKRILFFGLRYFYTNTETRRMFVDQLKLTYRTSLKLMINRQVLFVDKMLYIMHKIYYSLPNFHKIRLGVVNKAASKLLLAIVYIFNYVKRSEPVRLKKETFNNSHIKINNNGNINLKLEKVNSPINKKKVLITRAMGGIGDLLMMTPGIHELKKKYPQREIHLAIPSRYFQIFENNHDVKLIDIEEDFFSHLSYSKWFNFTDCPASRNESRKAPKVKKNRIDIFATSLGVKGIRHFRMNRSPRYFISKDEHEFADKFFERIGLTGKKVVGVQLHSDESYRDYPQMEGLISVLSKNYNVLLFDSHRIEGYNIENVIKVDSFGLREAFAIANKCDAIIAPDSSFVHFAAAFAIPTIALFGPIDGKVRTKGYSNCTFIDARKELGCLPCWRNESIPCKLTGMRNSACMDSIPLLKIVYELQKILNRSN